MSHRPLDDPPVTTQFTATVHETARYGTEQRMSAREVTYGEWPSFRTNTGHELVSAGHPGEIDTQTPAQ